MATQRPVLEKAPPTPIPEDIPGPSNGGGEHSSATVEGNGAAEKNFIDNRELLRVLLAACHGDFSVRLPVDWTGLNGKISDAFNEIMAANQSMADELHRVSQAVGREGKIRQRASFSSHGGAWRNMEDSVNSLITDLVWPISEITRTIGAVAKGD